MLDFLRNDRSALVDILDGALKVVLGVHFYLVQSRRDHCDVHHGKNFFEDGLFYIETAGALEGDISGKWWVLSFHCHFLFFFSLFFLCFHFLELDGDAGGVKGQDVGLIHEKVRSVSIDDDVGHEQPHGDGVFF